MDTGRYWYVVEINKGNLFQMISTGFGLIHEGSGHLKWSLFASQSSADMILIRNFVNSAACNDLWVIQNGDTRVSRNSKRYQICAINKDVGNHFGPRMVCTNSR